MKSYFKTEIARNYVVRFSKTASLTLARKMYIENVSVFRDVEDARSAIRYVRGLTGDKDRKSIKNKECIVEKYSLGNPYKLPKSHAVKAKTYTIPSKYNKILLISDLHIPYHDVTALSIAISYGKEKGANCIFINGDLLDFFQISRFMKTKRKRSVAQELETAREVLDILNREFPNVPIYLLKGN